ncbi:jg18562, partial [Pararge aegeria aegeria]
QPDTLVYWRRNGIVIERAHTIRAGVLRADVRVHNATRDELDAHYECLAQNADVTEPLSASVVVKMYRKYKFTIYCVQVSYTLYHFCYFKFDSAV